MPKPTIVCIPGPCHPAEIYLSLQSALSARQYTTIPVPLPSNGREPPCYDFGEDVVAIRSIIINLIEEDKDVIVVVQGFSGVATSQALHGLGKSEREAWGYGGGVVRLVFIMGWVVKEGFQAATRGDVANMFSYMRVDPSVSLSELRLSFKHDS